MDQNVTQWIDRSGNNNHPGQGTNAHKPTYAAECPQWNGCGLVSLRPRVLILARAMIS